MARAHPISYCLDYIINTPFLFWFSFIVLFFRMLMFVLFCLFIGNTLTPLTALTPVSDVGKTMLQPSSLSVLGDHQQFQAGLFVFYLFLFVYLFCLFLFHKSKKFNLLMCACVLSYKSLPVLWKFLTFYNYFDESQNYSKRLNY